MAMFNLALGAASPQGLSLYPYPPLAYGRKSKALKKIGRRSLDSNFCNFSKENRFFGEINIQVISLPWLFSGLVA